MDMRNELRLDWLPPPPLERKRKAQPQPAFYVFGDPDESMSADRSRDSGERNWRRGVAVYEI